MDIQPSAAALANTIDKLFADFGTQLFEFVYYALHPYDRCFQAMDIAMAGARLTSDEIEEMERVLIKQPNELRDRINLIGKYSVTRYRNPQYAARRADHVAWLVSHQPDHPILRSPFCIMEGKGEATYYDLIKVIWLPLIAKHHKNWQIQVNAAHFFYFSDKELSEKCFKRSVELRPNDRRLQGDLALFYALWKGHECEALTEAEKLCVPSAEIRTYFDAMSEIPRLAIQAEKLDRAVEAAYEILALAEQHPEEFPCRQGTSNARIALARIAVRDGHIETGKNYLEEFIHDYDHRFDVARELLVAGQGQFVVDYLDRHANVHFWLEPHLLAFQYEVETGKDWQEGVDWDDYYAWCRGHQLSKLGSMDSERRRTHVSSLIEATKDQIEFLKARTQFDEDRDDERLSERLGAEIEHLARLTALRDD